MGKSSEEEQSKLSKIVQNFQDQERCRRLFMKKGVQQGAFSSQSSETLTRRLQQELENETDLELLWKTNLPRWMKLTAESLNREADEVHRESEQLSRVLLGYKNRMDAFTPMALCNKE